MLYGHAPAVPTDGPLALMLAAARRGKVTTGSTTTTVTSQTASGGFLEAETMTISPSNGGRIVSDSGASAGKAIQLTFNSMASATVNLPESTALVIRAKATLRSGAPNLTLSVDGVPVTTVIVEGTSWANYTFTGVIPAGSHVISIASSNATSKRSLYVDTVTATTGSVVEDFTGSAGSAPDSSNWTANVG
ncbi:MAG: hypothetical protein KDB71_00635 [Mycobacterium sp.]|nr:hypothetical protein [Mycobacterium sp.]